MSIGAAAKQRGYSQGYAAGRRKAATDARDDFRRAAFLAALPSMLDGNWRRGEQPSTLLSERVTMAWEAADLAMKHARF